MFRNTKFQVYEVNDYRFIKALSEEPNARNLVCLHGMFGGLSNFDHLIDEVEDYSVYVPEIPLYSLPKKKLSITGLAKWFRAFVEDQDIKNPVILGNSMGGHVALEYALLYPDEVRALILTGSSGLLENGFGSTVPRRNDPNYIREQANLTFYDDIVDDTMVDEIMEVVQSPAKLIRLLWIARNTQNYNMESELPNIGQPTLLVWGKNDIITPPEVGETFCRKMPNAQLKWIDKCGHAPMMERPEQFVTYLKKFLADLNNNSTSNSEFTNYEKDYPHL